jgi:DNA-binding LacI/PurR family transcriptional regulator
MANACHLLPTTLPLNESEAQMQPTRRGHPRPGGRAVTLDDVARQAGVAISTVSRALSNPDRVSARTRALVEDVARQLDYRPNRIAQALPSGRTQMLALLVPDITNPHNFGLIRGAEAEARAAGYTLVLGDTQESAEFEAAHTDRLSSTVDGFVLAGSRVSEQDLRRLQQRRPVVLFNREAHGFPSVVTDSVEGSRHIIDHLVALGHRSIAYLAGPRNAWTDGVRRRALARYATQAGATVVRCGPFAPTLEQGPGAADVGLATGATALVAFNDLMAIGVLQRLAARGVEVPGEVSVVGYDDIFGADFCHPPLTTVVSPAEQSGRSLIDLLLNPRPEAPSPRVVLSTQLRLRESSGPARSR